MTRTAFLVCALCLGGCAAKTEEQGGEAHMLTACNGDNDCGAGQGCVERVCMPDETGPSAPSRNVPNPTGDCVATSDGSGVEYAPSPTDVYLPDCAAPLAREYYRVFVQEDDTAYMTPRPDNHPDFATPCGDDEDPLKAVLDRYDLCQQEAFDTAQVAQVNAMTPSDALAIGHFLHERLVFVTEEYGVRPGPRGEDILELCQTDEAFRNGPLKARCDFEIDAAESGARNSIGWVHTGEAGQILADALNALYGISGESLCDRLEMSAKQTLFAAIDAARTCMSDDDCIQVWRSTSCFDACSDAIAASSAGEIEAAQSLLEDNQCAAFARAGCSSIAPPCDPPGGPSCVDGACY